jgi:ABC-2 type transport system permease protein
VRLRDTMHFVELALLAWFWITPIVYAWGIVHQKLGEWTWLYMLNPVVDIVLTFQRAIYAQTTVTTTTNGKTTVTELLPPTANQWWYLWHLLIVIAVSGVLFLAALAYFGRAEGDFAEEL